MNADSLIGHIVELVDLTSRNSSPADQTLSTFLRQRHYLGAKDRRFISDILFGIIRHRRYIEALLEEYLRLNPGQEILDAPRHRALAIYAVYAGVHSDSPLPLPSVSLWQSRFPETPLTSYSGWMTEHRGLDFLGSEGDGIIRLGVEHSFQDWMVRDLHGQYGQGTERLLRSLNAPARVTLRVNLSNTDRERCRARLREEGVNTEPTPLSPAGLVAGKRFNTQASAAFNEGWFEMQDEGSQILSLIASPRPGSEILDACAGAGGKSLHLADLMKGTGRIFAADPDRGRLNELDTRARRAGVRIIESVTAKRPLPDFFIADLVLVDAPCSGTGTIRRNPDIKWRVTGDSVERHAIKQLELLESNSRFVKPGGILMYATCSLLRKENEEVVESFMHKHPEFGIVNVNPEVCPPTMITGAGFVRILPYDADTDGFFAAKLRRVAPKPCK